MQHGQVPRPPAHRREQAHRHEDGPGQDVARQMVKLGGQPKLRENFTTDNGNLILDVHNLSITNPVELEAALNQITGVVTNGLFARRGADVLVVESTYGNRLHKSMADTMAELEHAVTDTLLRKKGNVIIPAFAVGRTQEMLYLLVDLYKQGRLPDMNIYVDSPMALKATDITAKHWGLLDPEAAALMEWMKRGRGKPKIHFVQDAVESVNLQNVKHGAVIISASGMCNAGRIKHHLRNNLPRRDSSILIVGFQAAGTLGRRIVDGVKNVRIFGVPVPVKADVYTIGGLSAHGDQAALLGWLGHFKPAPQRTFVVHGEPTASESFAAAIHEKLGWSGVDLPAQHSSVIL